MKNSTHDVGGGGGGGGMTARKAEALVQIKPEPIILLRPAISTSCDLMRSLYIAIVCSWCSTWRRAGKQASRQNPREGRQVSGQGKEQKKKKKKKTAARVIKVGTTRSDKSRRKEEEEKCCS